MLKCPGIAMLVAAALTAHAHAQCEHWLTSPFGGSLFPGVNGDVEAITSWDPDGAGPQPLSLVIAGDFSEIQRLPMDGIGAWNGSVWTSLGDPPGTVHDLAVLSGSLIAACGPAGIARWVPGQGWLQLGPVTGQVECMTVFGGALIAGGSFLEIGGVSAGNIARWAGAAWQPLGDGVSDGAAPRVRALTVFNDELIAGGEFHTAGGVNVRNIARWNGSSWSEVGYGVFIASPPSAQASVQSLVVFEGSLYAGGRFNHAGPIADPVAAKSIARWNGTAWSFTGSFFHNEDEVVALAVDSWLYAGGAFGIVRYDGVQWSAVPNEPQNLEVGTLGVHDNNLFVGCNDPGGLLRWTGFVWHSLMVANESVLTFAQLGSRMVAAGHFTRPTPAGPPVAYHIAAWDGMSFEPHAMGSGLNDAALSLMSFVQPSGANELVVGGGFTVAGGAAASRVARWVEEPLGFPPPAWAPMGPGFSSTVHALARFKGATIAAGHFTQSGTAQVNRIARWDGSAWQPITSGLNARVWALKAAPGATMSFVTLIVGGEFTTAGGLPASRIARWTESVVAPGGSWDAMGSGFNGTVRAVERHQNSTYAAGEFTASGATPLNRVARWTGSAWVDVGGGFNGTVRALKSSGGFLYAAGEFTSGPHGVHVARWDGAAWSALPNAQDGLEVSALGEYQGEIHAGSDRFGEGWLRYTPAGVPWIVTQPLPEVVACDENATFKAPSARGYNAQHQWRKNGVALSNGSTGTGSFVSGATSSTLEIFGVSQMDQGAYDAVVSSTCGAVTSSAASLTVTGTCPGACYPDCNGDTVLNLADFGCFQTKFALGDPYADCNGDTVLNLADFGCFQTKFALGCP